MLVESIDEVHFVLIEKSEHLFRAGRNDFQGNVGKLTPECLKAVPEEPVTQRIRHRLAFISLKRPGVVGYPSDFIGKSCDLMSQPENFTAFRCQFDRVIDTVEKRKAE